MLTNKLGNLQICQKLIGNKIVSFSKIEEIQFSWHNYLDQNKPIDGQWKDIQTDLHDFGNENWKPYKMDDVKWQLAKPTNGKFIQTKQKKINFNVSTINNSIFGR